MKFCPEIDGVRTIAVIPVILFHVAIPGFSEGFVGVDIFFAISGYLITTIVVADIDGSTGFANDRFYERRARRVLPAPFTQSGELMSADGSHRTPASARYLGGLIFTRPPLNAYLAASASAAP